MFRMTANDWLRLDLAEERIALRRRDGLEPDPGDEAIVAEYSKLPAQGA